MMILAIQKDVVIIFEFQGFLLEHIISKKFDKIKVFKMTIFYALDKTTLLHSALQWPWQQKFY